MGVVLFLILDYNHMKHNLALGIDIGFSVSEHTDKIRFYKIGMIVFINLFKYHIKYGHDNFRDFVNNVSYNWRGIGDQR